MSKTYKIVGYDGMGFKVLEVGQFYDPAALGIYAGLGYTRLVGLPATSAEFARFSAGETWYN